MTEGDSPTGARRRVSMTLGAAREAAGYTHLGVAAETGWRLSVARARECSTAPLEPWSEEIEPGQIKCRLEARKLRHEAALDIPCLGADGNLSNAAPYREADAFAETLEDFAIEKANPAATPPPGPVVRHYDRYQKLWNAADSEDNTIAFIRRRIRELVAG